MPSMRGYPLIILVDRDPALLALVSRWIREAGMQTIECSDAQSFLESLDTSLPDVVCLDTGLSMTGRQALDAVSEKHPGVPVLMLTAEDSADAAMEALRHGACDYLTKPVDQDRLLKSIQHALRTSQQSLRVPATEPIEEVSYSGVIGRSAPMRELFRQIDRVAGRDISVVIHGESGTGKELIARAIHENSRRAGGPFVAINCAAIPESLQDSELFGHEKGSFTGAYKARAGCFERADGGTLFLDEVAELSLGVQAKLLRVLQERSFERLGGIRTLKSDFRLITATHSRLHDRVSKGLFREDLYFRVAVFELELPSLRTREGDLRLLVPRLLEAQAADLKGGPRRVSERAMAALERYPFPGNVRELENILQCAAVLSSGEVIDLQDLPSRVRDHQQEPPEQVPDGDHVVEARPELVPPTSHNGSQAPDSIHSPLTVPGPQGREVEDLPLNLGDLERWAVERAVRDKGGRLTEAAKALGIGRTTLYRKLEKYGLR